MKLRDINKRLHEVEVSLFAPLKPMLGKQAKPNEVSPLLSTQPLIYVLLLFHDVCLHSRDLSAAAHLVQKGSIRDTKRTKLLP